MNILPIFLLLLITIFKLSNSIKIGNNNNIINYNSDKVDVEPPPCGDLKVCLFTELDYQGKTYEYSIYNGYLDLPNFIKNNITSFVSNADVCFITFKTEFVNQTIYSGEFLSNYYIIFGDLVEGIQPGKCVTP